MEPKRERLGAGSGWRPHADPVGMTMVERCDICCECESECINRVSHES